MIHICFTQYDTTNVMRFITMAYLQICFENRLLKNVLPRKTFILQLNVQDSVCSLLS